MPPFEIVHNFTRTGSPMYAMTSSHCGLVSGYLTETTPGTKIKSTTDITSIFKTL